VDSEMVAHDIQLRYFDKTKYGEVDFLLSTSEGVIPIEAKSGNDYKAHKALTNIMNVSEWKIDEAIVLCKGNVSTIGDVTYLPWYAAMLFDRDE